MTEVIVHLARAIKLSRLIINYAAMKNLLLIFCFVIISNWGQSVLADLPAAERLFVRRVAPLLREKCLGCHGGDPEEIEGSLDMRSLRGLLQGGDSGEPVVVAGRPDESPLLLAATWNNDDWSPMPPKEAEKLSPKQLASIGDWIVGGAPWPNEAREQEILAANAERWSAEDGVSVKTSGGLGSDWTNRKYKPDGLWAYQPVRKPKLDDEKGTAIDRLLAAKYQEDFHPAPRADRVTLIRRATFDLTGLPPSPEEVEAFVRDPQSDDKAFAGVVDRLLDSPHYGERMAQHWLDVVRYADSSGFANDYERGSAWRYRDYVIRSFNDDKPYRQFVREQLAGDEIEPDNPEMLVATGFLRMGPWELTGMEVAAIARQRFLDDVTNSIGETFLAHSLQCARCHDHKFDPIPTRDYYSIQAVFTATQLAERGAPFLAEENTNGFEEQNFLEIRRKEYLATLGQLDAVLLKNAEQWYTEHNLSPEAWRKAVKQVGGRSHGVFAAARGIFRKQGAKEDQYPPKLYGFTPKQFGLERIARKGLQRLSWEFDRYQPVALAVYNGSTPNVKSVASPVRIPADHAASGSLEETCILAGGDPFSRGEKVEPGVLSVLNTGAASPIPKSIMGRRAAFADWVASADNPLTTRAIVNRIWMWHFNEPIAGNPNNFGSTGGRPTHGELLDWLAATFVEDDWSFKAMHGRMMNTEAYCRSSTTASKDVEKAGYETFLPRRLSAEEMRDAMLAISGELNATLGGIPCRPEINTEVAVQPRQVMGTFAAAWTPNSLPSQRHRRSVYTLKLRGLAAPMLKVFNVPSPDFSCERRDSSTVTPQVFSLFNSQNSHQRALALANRVVSETQSDKQAIERCFQLAFSRPVTEAELDACLTHWREIETLLPEEAPAAVLPPHKVRRDAVEENTGEPFSFEETLHANDHFVSDLQPRDVDKHVRALADVCLAILNSNEFVYVY